MAASEGEGGSSPSRKGLILARRAVVGASVGLNVDVCRNPTSCGPDILITKTPELPTACGTWGGFRIATPKIRPLEVPPPKTCSVPIDVARYQSMVPPSSVAVPF